MPAITKSGNDTYASSDMWLHDSDLWHYYSLLKSLLLFVYSAPE